MPEGTPYVSSNYPNPNLRKDYITKLGNTQNDIQNDETKGRHAEEQKVQVKKEKKHTLERKEIARQLSDRATSRPRALERSGDKKGGGREMGGGSGANTPKHTITRILQNTI